MERGFRPHIANRASFQGAQSGFPATIDANFSIHSPLLVLTTLLPAAVQAGAQLNITAESMHKIPAAPTHLDKQPFTDFIRTAQPVLGSVPCPHLITNIAKGNVCILGTRRK